MTPTLPLAAGYVRGSTEEQQGTLTAQSQQIAQYCQYRGFQLACEPSTLDPRPSTFLDSGTSGSTRFYDRPVVQRMLAWMHSAGVRHLVMTKLDRGFRNALDCLYTVDHLNARGIFVHILNLQLDTSTPVGRFTLTIMAGVAELENGVRSERQKDVFKVRRAQSRRCGTVPYGKVLNPADPTGPMLDDAVEQLVLARLLTGDLAPLSANAAARLLNAERIPAKQGGGWHGATVAQIRRNQIPDTGLRIPESSTQP